MHKVNNRTYHPERNGAIEMTHKTIVEYLFAFVIPEVPISTTDYHFLVLYIIPQNIP